VFCLLKKKIDKIDFLFCFCLVDHSPYSQEEKNYIYERVREHLKTKGGDIPWTTLQSEMKTRFDKFRSRNDLKNIWNANKRHHERMAKAGENNVIKVEIENKIVDKIVEDEIEDTLIEDEIVEDEDVIDDADKMEVEVVHKAEPSTEAKELKATADGKPAKCSINYLLNENDKNDDMELD